jgi:hypothetical protein
VISEKTAAEQVAQADAQSLCLLNSMLSARRFYIRGPEGILIGLLKNPGSKLPDEHM